MSINPEDVRLYESQRLTDTDDGGGRATGHEVVDNLINNLFPDISRLDRTIGDVSLRKGFVGINTNNSDDYLGAHAIITKPPLDPNVHAVLFHASNEADEREHAQDRIESYVVQGAAAQFELLGNQYQGQRQIVVIQREEVTIPSTGDVYMLEDLGNQQYIRVTDVDEELTTFTYETGGGFVDFIRRRMVLSISAPLAHTFRGGQPKPSGTTSPKADVFQTEVADAARYYGVTRSTDDAEIGDLSIEVASIYAPLVPSAQTEQALADQPFGYDRLDVRAAAGADYTETVSAIYTSGTNLQAFINRPAVRGSLQLTLGGSLYADDGKGALTRTTGSNPFATLEIDYDSGAIFGTRDSGSGSGTIAGSATYRPGSAFVGRAITARTDVTINNRGFNWIESFAETKPRPGTAVISYMALGKWYEIRDPGNGVLAGAGVGSINFATGTITVTLLALPDVGSSIMYSFIMDVEEEIEQHDGTVSGAIPAVELQLEGAIVPGSVDITWTSGGSGKSASDNGSGAFTGHATGEINYGTGEVTLYPNALHDDGTTFDVEYDAGTRRSVTKTTGWSDGSASGTLPHAPLMSGSIAVWLSTTHGTRLTARDNGAGGWTGGLTGAINYATGEYTIGYAADIERTVTNYYEMPAPGGPGSFERRTVEQNYTDFIRATGAYFDYREDGDTSDPQTLNDWSPDQLVLTLIDDTDDPLIAGSLLFVFAGETYYDRDGVLYKDFASTTGAGTAVGSVNYNERTVTLDTWTGGAGPGIVIRAAITAARATLVSSIIYRTPGAPLRPESVSVVATDINGNIISATADVDGVFAGASIIGTVNYETGVIDVRFTTDPDDDTGESEVPVFSDARYSAVVYSYLPLDAELIGLDPVRLPSDGRVPIFRRGEVIVIAHTTETDIGTPTDGQVVNLARDHQAFIGVVDAEGTPMDPAQYTVDLEAGTVTFADPVTLQDAATDALVTPLAVLDRIEHMSVANDVEITGKIAFIAPLPHAYPAEETVVSSALLWGDIFCRVHDLFTQRVWSSGSPNWTDELIGDDTTANYNDVDYPILVANHGAITEKWAIWFTSSTAFNVVGQTLGIIGTGNINTDCAPANPNTGNPYFVIPEDGWGVGWATNNVLRFNTTGCLAPLWIARTVLSGAATEEDDAFTLQLRGDAD